MKKRTGKELLRPYFEKRSEIIRPEVGKYYSTRMGETKMSSVYTWCAEDTTSDGDFLCRRMCPGPPFYRVFNASGMSAFGGRVLTFVKQMDEVIK
jgi:hypothetical protein